MAPSESGVVLRVIHVITRLIIGGAQENTVASVRGLRGQPGLEVQLFSGPTTGPEGALLAGDEAHADYLSLVPRLVRPVHPWQDALAGRDLVRRFQRLRPHIVHTHSGKAGILGRFAAARARVPVIIHTIHGPSFGAFQGWLPNALFTWAERRAARHTTHFVSVAEAMTRQYLAAGVGRPEQFTRIYSGFNLEPFLRTTNTAAGRAAWGLAPDDFVVGKIARLFKLKGHDDLLALAPGLIARQPRTKFLLVGGGAWRGRLEAKVRFLGLQDHFRFTGLVRPERIPELIGLMDVVVHLSRREGLPRALPQALAAAKPVVAYDCAGAREVCRPNETGYLIPAGERAELAQRLAELAEHPERRRRLGEAGRRLAREWFPVERMVNELHALYLKLAADRGIRPQT